MCKGIIIIFFHSRSYYYQTLEWKQKIIQILNFQIHPNTRNGMNKFISIHQKIGMETKYSFLFPIIVYQTPPKSINRGITRATNLFVFILLMKGNGFSTINTHGRVPSLAFENIYFACISIYQGSKGVFGTSEQGMKIIFCFLSYFLVEWNEFDDSISSIWMNLGMQNWNE